MTDLFPVGQGVTAKNSRLLRNPSIQRMPETQNEWQQFVAELNKWTRDQEGSFTVSFQGFSADPTNVGLSDLVGTYHIYGKVVFLQFDFDVTGLGTSNATHFRIDNMPDVIKPKILQQGTVPFGHDNSTTFTDPVIWRVHPKEGAPTTYDMEFFIQSTASNGISNWTASGTKGFVNEIQIVYSLWDATL